MALYDRSDIIRWLVAMLAHPRLRQRIPLEAGVSFPALSRTDEDDDVILNAFHYVVLRDSGGTPAKYATFSRVSMRAADLKLLDFSTFDEQVLFKGMSLDAPYTVHIIDSSWHSELKLGLAEHFADIATAYVQRQPAGESGRLFVQQYARLLPPSLIPYYRALSPSFFEWLLTS